MPTPSQWAKFQAEQAELKAVVGKLQCNQDQLKDKVESLETRGDAMKADIDDLGIQVQDVNVKIEIIETREDSMQTEIDDLGIKLQGLDDRTEGLEEKVEEIKVGQAGLLAGQADLKTGLQSGQEDLKAMMAVLLQRVPLQVLLIDVFWCPHKPWSGGGGGGTMVSFQQKDEIYVKFGRVVWYQNKTFL